MFRKEKCIKNAKWKGAGLYCSKCGEPIAFRYIFDKEVRVVVFQAFKKYANEIKKREDHKEITEDGDVVGTVNFCEFNEFRDNIRQSTRELFSVSEDEGGICKDSEGEDAAGVDGVCTDDEVDDTYDEEIFAITKENITNDMEE